MTSITNKINYRSALEDLNVGVAVFNRNEEFVYVNSVVESIFDIPEERLIGRKLSDFVNIEIASQCFQGVRGDMTDISVKYELEFEVTGKNRKTVQVTESKYDGDIDSPPGKVRLFVDISRQKQIEREAQNKLRVEALICEVFNCFVHVKRDNLDVSVNKALKMTGKALDADSAYIFLFSEDGQFCSNTHEWCEEGIEFQMKDIRDIPVDTFSWWINKLKKGEIIHFPSISNLPYSAVNIKNTLNKDRDHSILIVPFLTSGRLVGVIGVSSVKKPKTWSEEEAALLKMLGDTLCNSLERINYEDQLICINERLEEAVEERTRDLLELTEINKAIVSNVDLFIVSTDPLGAITSVNPFALNKLGYELEEVVGRNPSMFLYSPVGFDDKGSDFERISCLFSFNGAVAETVLITKQGFPIHVLVSSSSLKNGQGDIVGYVGVAIDVSERKESERHAVILRDLGFLLASTTTIEQAICYIIEVISMLENVVGAGVYMINNQSGDLDLILYSDFFDKKSQYINTYESCFPRLKLVMHRDPFTARKRISIENIDFDIENRNPEIVPIGHDGDIIGAICLLVGNAKHLTPAEKITLEIITAQIGGTIERINTENELKNSQGNFKLLFETMEDLIVVLDDDGRVINTNPAVGKKLGYGECDLIGKSFFDLFVPEKRTEVVHIIADALEGNAEISFIPFCTKSNRLIPVESRIVYGKWDGKNVLYCISRDISERVNAEAALRESEQRWSFALEGSGDGVWDWNVQTNEVFFSKHWKQMLGYDPDEIENRLEEWEKRVHPDDLELCYESIRRHLSGEFEVYVNEHRLLCKDGTYKWILDRGKVFERSESGEPIRLIGTHTDITQRKILEKKLMDTIEKEKELNDLKSHFLSTASHEFRTPLSSILMLSEMLLSYQHKMDNEQIALRLQRIKENIVHLTSIVNDVLQLSKIQEGKSAFNPSIEDIVSLCRGIVDDLNSTLFRNGGIRFSANRQELMVCIDRRIITQSIINLLSNSIKYTKSNPDISLDLIVEPDEWVVCVKDNGIGIPEIDQKHLFEPFYRAGNVGSIQGNGLGLSIVLESVRLHCGNITFKSELSKGSTFFLHFPLSLNLDHKS